MGLIRGKVMSGFALAKVRGNEPRECTVGFDGDAVLRAVLEGRQFLKIDIWV
jgi:hypothetical protein